MRAKFKCESVTNYESWQNVKLRAVYSGDKNSEDNQFSTATPSGTIEMTISNPKAIGFIEPGKDYYIDFTKA